MGRMLSEQEFVNDNIFKYEQRMNSQYSRFLDKMPTYVTYYNISNISSSTDNGFENVEAYIGDNSPIRFNKVENFPIYGIEQVVLDLSEEEEGLNISFESEAVILPNTVKPLPGDFFIINHLDIDIQFMVTEIKYDTIKSNNFYKISYSVKSLSSNEELDKQVSDRFKCIVSNIGTDDKCLIKEDEYEKLMRLYNIINTMSNRYTLFFYNEKFNVFTVKDSNNRFIHDPYLTMFLYKNGLFNSKNDYKTIVPTIIGDERMINLFYDMSMYKSIEHHKKPKKQTSTLLCDNDMNSPFNYYRENAVITTFPGNEKYLPDDFFDNIDNCNVGATSITRYSMDIIVMYLNNLINTIYQIDLDKLEEDILILPDYQNMIINGIVLVVLKICYDGFISNKN